jgi:hypothetical protein
MANFSAELPLEAASASRVVSAQPAPLEWFFRSV